jgi:uncharacterized protein
VNITAPVTITVTAADARRRALALLAATVAFVALVGAAMASYHGGSRLDPGAPHYLAFGNFLSDLGTSVTYSGASNTVSRSLFIVAMSIVGAALAWSAPIWGTLGVDRRGDVAARVASAATVLAGIGFVAVGLIPWNRDLNLHVLVVQLTFASLVVFAASLVFLRVRRDLGTRYFGSEMALLGCLLAYTVFIVIGPGLGSTEGMRLQITAQKIVIAVTLLVICMQAFSIARRRVSSADATASTIETVKGPGRPPRLAGVDLARAVAMFGMLIVHTRDNFPVISAPDRALMWVNVWVGPLFVLVAGVGLSLGWQHRGATRFRSMVLLRAVALLLIGLWLESLFLGSILQYFAIFFVLGVLVLGASRRVLLGLSAACLVAGPLVITFLLRAGNITLFLGADRGIGALGDPVALTRALTVDGLYPAIVWAGFFFAGMAIGQLDLRDRRIGARLAVIGGALGAIGCFVGWVATRTFGSDPNGWTHHWTAAAHSESLTWALTALALACGILGVSLLIAERVRSNGVVMAPVLALAQVPLTFYLLHLEYSDTLWWNLSSLQTTTGPFLAATFVFYAVFAGGAWVWLRVFRHGPVEGLIDFVARAIVRPKPLPAQPRQPVGAADSL